MLFGGCISNRLFLVCFSSKPAKDIKKASQLRLAFRGSPNWARTSDIMINSHALYRLSYGGIYEPCIKKIQGDVGITYFSGRLPSEYFRHV